MTSADDFQHYADMTRIIEDFAAGNVELIPTGGPVPEIPPPDAPHHVIRVLHVPFDVDEQARAEANRRGVDAETVLAEWVTARS
jgi:hypothetical protein